ncbi:CynX/NimT family MFS transporter [Arthrobacter sp. ISL-30]|uniref:MFS transporter n=1 Tax=Arthrobacter sp. ISL-30 TaxID=2819109 RepID=UPI001BED067F|nr:MFS transporter [Arthrobacter sp. ISL-30]MBT2513238.1 MFS transporter [Arthrobacter sp. ISL-30]
MATALPASSDCPSAMNSSALAKGSAGAAATPDRSRWMLVTGVIAIVLVGLNLRAGIAGASTLFHDLQQLLGYGALVAAILPSIPTLCFALAGAATPLLTRRIGVEKSILFALALLTAGLLVRGIPTTGMLVLGTVVGMSGLAICNVAMPSLIREHFARRTSMMTALYTVSMTGGATAFSMAMVPLSQQLGSPSLGIGALGLVAAAAFLAFLPVVLQNRRAQSAEPRQHVSPWPLLRTRQGILLTGIFTLQALLAYAVMSWFPYILTTQGLGASESGILFGLLQLISVPAGMVLLAIGSRPSRTRLGMYLASVSMVLGLALMLFTPPALAAVPAVLLGVGLGIFPLVMVLISRSGTSTAETTAMSTLAQSVGYFFATVGPFGMGLLHAATGGWTLPFVLLLAVAFGLVAVGHLLTAGNRKSGSQDSVRQASWQNILPSSTRSTK